MSARSPKLPIQSARTAPATAITQTPATTAAYGDTGEENREEQEERPERTTLRSSHGRDSTARKGGQYNRHPNLGA